MARAARAHRGAASMKGPPEEKGNRRDDRQVRRGARGLNEGPSESEGQPSRVRFDGLPWPASMKGPPKVKGNSTRPSTFVRLVVTSLNEGPSESEGQPEPQRNRARPGPASMKGPPKVKGNRDSEGNMFAILSASMKGPPKVKGNMVAGVPAV